MGRPRGTGEGDAGAVITPHDGRGGDELIDGALSSAGLSNLSAVALSAAVATCVLLHVRRNLNLLLTGRNVTLLSLGLWYLLEAVRIPDDLRTYSQAEYDFGLLLLTLATGTFLAAYHAVDLPLFDDLGRRLSWLDRPSRVWPLVLAGVAIGVAPILYFSGFDPTIFWEEIEGVFVGKKRWDGRLQRGRYGGLRDALLELQMFLLAVVPLAVVVLTDRRAAPGVRIFCGTFVSWVLLRALAGGSRSQVAPVILPVLAGVYWKAAPRMRTRLILFGVPALAVAGYFWSAYVVVNRNSGTQDLSGAVEADYVGFEMFRELLWMDQNIPARIGHQLGLTYYAQLVNPVPRFLWPGKPVSDAGLLIAEAKGMVDSSGEAYLTNSPGFLGEAYLNFGVLGVLLVPAAAGVVVRAWDRLFPLCGRNFVAFVVYAAGLATILLSGRSFNMGTFYGLLSLYGLLVLMQHAGRGGPVSTAAGGVR